VNHFLSADGGELNQDQGFRRDGVSTVGAIGGDGLRISSGTGGRIKSDVQRKAESPRGQRVTLVLLRLFENRIRDGGRDFQWPAPAGSYFGAGDEGSARWPDC